MEQWSPSYTCKAPIDLFEDVECAKSKRKLESGEMLEALEPPTLSKDTGAVRIRLRAESDGAVGFATIKEQGTIFLENAR